MCQHLDDCVRLKTQYNEIPAIRSDSDSTPVYATRKIATCQVGPPRRRSAARQRARREACPQIRGHMAVVCGEPKRRPETRGRRQLRRKYVPEPPAGNDTSQATRSFRTGSSSRRSISLKLIMGGNCSRRSRRRLGQVGRQRKS
jgi:hypothetical protein